MVEECERGGADDIEGSPPDHEVRALVHEQEFRAVGGGVVEALAVGEGDEFVLAAVNKKDGGASLVDGMDGAHGCRVEGGQPAGEGHGIADVFC